MALTQAERRRRSQARLIEAAAAVASRSSFQATSVQDIGTYAGMSRGAVNHAFGSKDELFKALIEAQAEQWRKIASMIAPAPSIGGWLDAHRDAFGADPRHRRMVLMLLYESLASPEHRGAVAALRTEVVDYTASHVEALQQHGDLGARVDPKSIANLIVTGGLGLIVEWDFEDPPDRATDYFAFRATVVTAAT